MASASIEDVEPRAERAQPPVLADTASASAMEPDSIVYDLQPLNQWKVKSRVRKEACARDRVGPQA